MSERVDHLIVGGGVYGLHVAAALAEAYPERSTMLVEQGSETGTRASTNNHGRLHWGYMYAENIGTARESRKNVARFSDEFGDAINHDVTSYYGIHKNSKMSPDEYEAFCRAAGLPYERSADGPKGLFGKDIEAVFRTPELTFSTRAVRTALLDRAQQAGVEVRTNHDISTITPNHGELLTVNRVGDEVSAKSIFNCAYSGINDIHARSNIPLIPSTYAEFSLFKMTLPEEARNISATVMCGPFPSIVSHNEGNSTHVLAHVTHSGNAKQADISPGKQFSQEQLAKRYIRILKDGRDSLPALLDGHYNGQMTEVKSYLGGKPGEADRVVHVLSDHGGLPGYNVILGGKVTSFYEAGVYAVAQVAGHAANPAA